MVTQLVLMRELLCVFSGNEMVFGLALGCWLLLGGMGAWLGRTADRLARPLAVLIVSQIAVALLPIGQVLLVRYGRDWVFPRGAMVGAPATLAACAAVLLPYCILTGYLLALACRLLGRGGDERAVGRVYLLDVLGDIAGGALFTFALVYWFNPFQSLYLVAALNLVLAGVLAGHVGRPILATACAVSLLGVGAAAVGANLDARSTQAQYPGQEVVFRGNSPYGRVVVTEQYGQYNFIQNGVPWFSTHEIEQVERTVHLAMAQRPQAQNVLLISGGVSGTAREILKYHPRRVDYVELDGLVLRAAGQFLPDALADPRIHVIAEDGRRFVRRTDRRYDVVIVDVPGPSTLQINRFYTVEFFREVRRILTNDGVLAFHLGDYENYVSRELARLLATGRRTVAEVFRHVLLLPLGRVFFLASEGSLTTDVAGRVEAENIPTLLIRRSYLDAELSPDRLADIRTAAEEPAPVNRDFNPRLYYDELRLWLSRFETHLGVAEIILLALAGAYAAWLVVQAIARRRAAPLAIFTTGFAASGLEVVLLLGFQILYGYVYQMLGLIVTAFMAGLAAGAWVGNRVGPRFAGRRLTTIQFLLGVYALLLPATLKALDRLPAGDITDFAAWTGVPVLSFILAVLVGMEFPLAALTLGPSGGATSTASRLYTADFLGAALGAILVAAALIPLLGVLGVCALAAGLSVLSGLLLLAGGVFRLNDPTGYDVQQRTVPSRLGGEE